MSMEKELYKALALVLLEGRTDQWGNQIVSPLEEAINKWSRDNHEAIAKAIIKHLTVDGMAKKIAESMIEKLQSTSWASDGERCRETLKEEVNKKLAEMLAKREFKKLKGKD